ncbi:MAG: hypothetical protein KGK08_11260, partial [Acidobacteriota bacterium]|nr:hypothetical protein [Acidobacteriota bacterium]
TGVAAHAQAAAVVTPLDRQLARIDFAIDGVGQLTKSVSGTNYVQQPLTQKASTTTGLVATLRYTRSPLVGLEGNFGYARYTENFSQYVIGGAQTKANEYTLGWLFHTPQAFGLKPFVSAGAGTIAFKPTPNGGQGLPEKARMAYYYSAGVDDMLLSNHFGVRVLVRQVFFKAPDFGQNYLTINQHTYTFEPGFGFFLKF